jgi:hypothetical protein
MPDSDHRLASQLQNVQATDHHVLNGRGAHPRRPFDSLVQTATLGTRSCEPDLRPSYYTMIWFLPHLTYFWLVCSLTFYSHHNTLGVPITYFLLRQGAFRIPPCILDGRVVSPGTI